MKKDWTVLWKILEPAVNPAEEIVQPESSAEEAVSIQHLKTKKRQNNVHHQRESFLRKDSKSIIREMLS